MRHTLQTERFDLVHHVSWGSLHQPPQVWKCGLPFVWGPLGGGQTWPTAFLDYAQKRRNFERFRGLVVKFACWNPSVLAAVRKADMIFATNRETLALLNRLGARRVELFGDCGVTPTGSASRRSAPLWTDSSSCLPAGWSPARACPWR